MTVTGVAPWAQPLPSPQPLPLSQPQPLTQTSMHVSSDDDKDEAGTRDMISSTYTSAYI